MMMMMTRMMLIMKIRMIMIMTMMFMMIMIYHTIIHLTSRRQRIIGLSVKIHSLFN